MRSLLRTVAGVLSTCILLGACDGPPPEPSNAIEVLFSCDDGSTVRLRFLPEAGRAMLIAPAGETMLEQQRVASGFLYTGRQVDYRGKGQSLMIDSPGEPTLRCEAEE